MLDSLDRGRYLRALFASGPVVFLNPSDYIAQYSDAARSAPPANASGPYLPPLVAVGGGEREPSGSSGEVGSESTADTATAGCSPDGTT